MSTLFPRLFFHFVAVLFSRNRYLTMLQNISLSLHIHRHADNNDGITCTSSSSGRCQWLCRVLSATTLRYWTKQQQVLWPYQPSRERLSTGIMTIMTSANDELINWYILQVLYSMKRNNIKVRLLFVKFMKKVAKKESFLERKNVSHTVSNHCCLLFFRGPPKISFFLFLFFSYISNICRCRGKKIQFNETLWCLALVRAHQECRVAVS